MEHFKTKSLIYYYHYFNFVYLLHKKSVLRRLVPLKAEGRPDEFVLHPSAAFPNHSYKTQTHNSPGRFTSIRAASICHWVKFQQASISSIGFHKHGAKPHIFGVKQTKGFNSVRLTAHVCTNNKGTSHKTCLVRASSFKGNVARQTL